MMRSDRALRLRDNLVPLFAVCLLSACAARTPGEPEVLGAVAAEVSASRFGVVVPAPDGPTLIGTRIIPLIPGTTFGWGLLIEGAPDDIAYREVYTLPAPPKEIVGGASQKGAALVEREARGTDDAGWLVGYWTLDKGDPPGRHVIDVYVGDARVYTFEFEIRLVPPPQPTPAP